MTRLRDTARLAGAVTVAALVLIGWTTLYIVQVTDDHVGHWTGSRLIGAAAGTICLTVVLISLGYGLAAIISDLWLVVDR